MLRSPDPAGAGVSDNPLERFLGSGERLIREANCRRVVTADRRSVRRQVVEGGAVVLAAEADPAVFAIGGDGLEADVLCVIAVRNRCTSRLGARSRCGFRFGGNYLDANI